MTTELPEPKSRQESYLAKAAGMDVAIPDKPESRLEQYLDAIAEGGGGGGGGTTDFDKLSNRPKYNGAAMTGETNIPLAPSVVQTTGTSTTDVMSQNATASMVYADPGTNYKIKIGGADAQMGEFAVAIGVGGFARGEGSVSIGQGASNYAAGVYSVTIGNSAKTEGHSRAVALGNATNAAFDNSVAIGTNAKTTRIGEVNVGADTSGRGYNNTNYRVIGGVHDPQLAQDAATKNYVDGLVGNVATALAAINNGTGA